MPEETTPDSSSNRERRDVELIAADVDFKPYLEAVDAASQRNRSTLFVLIATVVLVFTAFRNTTNPDWLDARLAYFQLASACNREKSESPECLQAKDYCRRFLFSDRKNPLLFGKEFDEELNVQIATFIKQRTEALSLHLPLFGGVIDVNDLGVIGGVFLAAIVYMLYAGLDREVDNLERAKKKAGNAEGEKRKENLELLLMTQVLASRKGVTVGVHVLLLFVFLVHVMVFQSDVRTWRAAADLEGPGWATVETIIDAVLLVVVGFFCYKSWRRQLDLDGSVDELIAACA